MASKIAGMGRRFMNGGRSMMGSLLQSAQNMDSMQMQVPMQTVRGGGSTQRIVLLLLLLLLAGGGIFWFLR